MKMNGLLQRCFTIDEKSFQKLDTSFSMIGQTIIGKRLIDCKKSQISNKDNPAILMPYTNDLTLFPEINTNKEESKKLKCSQERKDRAMTIQFKKTINNNITIINNIIQQSTEKPIQSNQCSPPKQSNKTQELKSVLKQPNKPKPRKSVRFKHNRCSFDLIDDEKEELPHKTSKVSCKTEVDKENDNTDNDTKSVDRVIYPKDSYCKEKERSKRDIDILPKCHCEKEIGVFKGFSALIYHNRNKIHNDKLTILINKKVSSSNSDNVDNIQKQINFFGLYHGINGDYTASLLKKEIHNYIINDKNVLSNPKLTIMKAHKTIEADCYTNHHKETLNDGSCSLILSEINSFIYISNIGNSRCIISSDFGAEVYNLSAVHSPLMKNEAERIHSKTSCEIKLESNGKGARIYPSGLNVSRVIGFSSAKGNSSNKGINGIDNSVISLPEIITIQSKDNMDFIIMISEGIANYLSNKDIIKIAYMSIKESLYSNDSYQAMLDKIIATIAKEAVRKESKGNMSLILLSMANLEKIHKEKLIIQVNQSINKLKIDKEEYHLMYPILFNSPQFNTGKRAKIKQSENSNSNNNANDEELSPLNAFRGLKVKSPLIKNTRTSKNNDETKANAYKNSLEYIEGVNANSLQSESKKQKVKKKKKLFFCLCWG